jgi:hypothetical protein
MSCFYTMRCPRTSWTEQVERACRCYCSGCCRLRQREMYALGSTTASAGSAERWSRSALGRALMEASPRGTVVTSNAFGFSMRSAHAKHSRRGQEPMETLTCARQSTHAHTHTHINILHRCCACRKCSSSFAGFLPWHSLGSYAPQHERPCVNFFLPLFILNK